MIVCCLHLLSRGIIGLGVGDDGHGVMKRLTLDVDEKVDGIAREVSVRPDPVVGFDEKTGGPDRARRCNCR
jgi:hypothetical protein